jgi:hypothetical protein
LFVLASASAFAQANSDLTGIVTDQTGAVIAGAKVTLTNTALQTSNSTETGATGWYEIAELNPGSYNLRVSAKGFETFQQNHIQV